MTHTLTPRAQISPSEGQRKARAIQRFMSPLAILAIVATSWSDGEGHSRLMNLAMTLLVAHLVIDAMRALASDSDQSPKGEDAAAASSRSDASAAPKGIAHD